MQSLFGRVSRYPRFASLDPRENRLTEATAAVLERVDGAAHEFVTALFGEATTRVAHLTNRPVSEASDRRGDSLEQAHVALEHLRSESRALVRTQVATPSGRFVDMEIWLRPRRAGSTVSDLVVWVEVKNGSDLHGDQLDAYVRDIRTHQATHKVVVLLAPRRDLPAMDAPSDVTKVDWQSVARALSARAFVDSREENDRWILAEYTDYLAEEGFMDGEALSALHALALMEADSAGEALAAVCEQADSLVEAKWGAAVDYAASRGADRDPLYGGGYWASFRPRPASKAWGHGAWFDWGLGYPSEWQYVDADEVRGSVAFYASVGFPNKDNPHSLPDNEPWTAKLFSIGFSWAWFAGGYRFVRVLYPDELLSETTLDGQAKRVADWVVETFNLLAGAPPPN